MWSRQLLMTAAVPVYPGDQLGPRQRRCAGQLQQLTRRLVRLCEITAVTAAAADTARKEVVSVPKQTADAAVDARDQPWRIPPLPDLVQSCTAAGDAGSRQRHHQQRQASEQQQQQQLQQPCRGKRDVAVLPAPGSPSSMSGQVIAAPAASAVPSDAVREIGQGLRRCADQLQSSCRKRRPSPQPSPSRHSGRTVSASAVMLSASALLLLWCCRSR